MTTQQDVRAMPTPVARPMPQNDVPSPREHLTSPRTQAVLKIQQALVAGARELLSSEGAVELFQPIIGPVTDPGARGAKQVDVDYYGHRYKLMTSAILYKQAALTSFDKIFFIAPNVRLEPLETTSTSRHLAEFHQIDCELANAGRDDALELAESLVKSVVERVLTDLPGELHTLGRDAGALAEVLTGHFG